MNERVEDFFVTMLIVTIVWFGGILSLSGATFLTVYMVEWIKNWPWPGTL